MESGQILSFILKRCAAKWVGSKITPILLFGERSYWEQKITANFQCNLKSGTIEGSEWISNCYYVVENAKEALEFYHRYFTNEIVVGPPGYSMKRALGLFLSRSHLLIGFDLVEEGNLYKWRASFPGTILDPHTFQKRWF